MSLCIVIVLLLMVVWFLDLCLSAAIFPDDDMARSDSWIKEESVRIQAKCLMETLVNICVRKFVLVCVFFV